MRVEEPIPLGTTLAEAERRVILMTVENTPTLAIAAKTLGIADKTLYNKLSQYAVHRQYLTDDK